MVDRREPTEAFEDIVDRTLDAIVGKSEGSPDIQRFVVGWSGGLDSTFLLEVFGAVAQRTQAPRFELIPVHIHHGLRQSADADVDFCRSEADRRGLELIVHYMRMEDRTGVQEAARRRRYALLTSIARAHEADHILTGHHADDTLETALLNFARGTSLDGLVSLKSAHSPAPLSDICPDARLARIWRPLIDVRRQTIDSLARSRRLRWIEDPTNRGHSYTRNRLRHDLVPALVDAYDGTDATQQTLNNLVQERSALESLASDIYRRAKVAVPSPALLRLRVSELLDAPTPIRLRTLRLAAREEGLTIRWDRTSLDALAVALADVERAKQRDGRFYWRSDIGGATVEITHEEVDIWRDSCLDWVGPEIKSLPPITLDVSRAFGEVRWLGHRIFWNRVSPVETRGESGSDVSTSSKTATTQEKPVAAVQIGAETSVTARPVGVPPALSDASPTRTGASHAAIWTATGGNAVYRAMIPLDGSKSYTIRGPVPGERMHVDGMKGTKKLVDLLRDAQIPPHKRNRWPVIATDDNCKWLVGIRTAPDIVPVEGDRFDELVQSPGGLNVLDMPNGGEPGEYLCLHICLFAV